MSNIKYYMYARPSAPSIRTKQPEIYRRCVTSLITDVYPINNIPDDIVTTRAQIVQHTILPVTSAMLEHDVYEQCYQLMLEELNQFNNNREAQKQRELEELSKIIANKYFLYRNIIDSKHKQQLAQQLYNKKHKKLQRQKKINRTKIWTYKRYIRDWKDDFENRDIELNLADNKIYRIKNELKNMENGHEKDTLLTKLVEERKNRKRILNKHKYQYKIICELRHKIKILSKNI